MDCECYEPPSNKEITVILSGSFTPADGSNATVYKEQVQVYSFYKI